MNHIWLGVILKKTRHKKQLMHLRQLKIGYTNNTEKWVWNKASHWRCFYYVRSMAKDDYYILAGKILVYLYARLKGKNDQKPKEYLHALLKNNSDNSMTAL